MKVALGTRALLVIVMAAATPLAAQETGAASMKDMGKLMKATLARLAGKTADGARVSQMVKEKLS